MVTEETNYMYAWWTDTYIFSPIDEIVCLQIK